MSSGEAPSPEKSKPPSPADGVAPRQRVKRRREPLFQLEAFDQARPPLTPLERIKSRLFTGGVGFSVSVLVHAVIVVVLALIVFQSRRSASFDTFVVSWAPPEDLSARPAKSRRPVAIPIEIPSIPDKGSSQSSAPTVGVVDAASAVGVRPVDVGGALAGRNQRARGGTLEQMGGSPDAERAVSAGLAWFARQQASDGHWELHQGYPDAGRSYVKTDTGATALALLAFLGHGQTHQLGEHQQVVAKGLSWLQKIQDRTTGDLHDQRQEEGRNPSFYAHSMATIVLCEALALTGDAQLRPSAELAVKYLVDSQHPDLGGWKYRPLTNRVMSGDLSVTAWALMALNSARIAGIDVRPEEFERTSHFLDQVQEKGGARYKYEPNEPTSRITAARTAMGLLCRQWLGWPKSHPPMVDGIQYLMDERFRPQWTSGRRNVFEWYYITQVTHNVGGDDWKIWNSAVRDVVIRSQVTSGGSKPGQDTRGSWSPKPEGEGEEYADKAGRLYLTSMCVLILETPYRHRPIYAEP